MVAIRELSFSLRAMLKVYPWRKIDPVPCTKLKKSITESRVALVTSAGLVSKGDKPFDETVKGGDYSYRIISKETDVSTLKEFHRSDTFDHSGILQDPNLAFPLDRLKEMERDQEIGSVAPQHFSFMGSITAPGRLRKYTAPQAADLLVQDQVDIALLIPV